jgi:ribonuclease PH
MGVYGQADGSAYLEQGNTRVLAAVYGPHDMRDSRLRPQTDKVRNTHLRQIHQIQIRQIRSFPR